MKITLERGPHHRLEALLPCGAQADKLRELADRLDFAEAMGDYLAQAMAIGIPPDITVTITSNEIVVEGLRKAEADGEIAIVSELAFSRLHWTSGNYILEAIEKITNHMDCVEEARRENPDQIGGAA